MNTTAGLTDHTRGKLKSVVAEIRERLISDIYAAGERKFSFSIKDRNKLKIPVEHQYQYSLLKNWCEDPIRNSRDFDTNVRSVIKEVAYTLTNRIFIIKRLEARNLQKVHVVTGGKESPGYKDFREFCPQLCQGDDEGYGFLLKQLFDKLVLELPGFFSNTGIIHIFDIPGPTLFWLVEQLNLKDLEGAWTDDTTLGWLYQYWNDPDREAVNAKVQGKGVKKGKVEAHEIAYATQLFTERYMVEWLLQNSLGTQWLAICAKQGWEPSANEIIRTLENRRQGWREKIENKEVSSDIPMPIETKEEDLWKFYTKQEIPGAVIDAAPDSIKGVTILDPACGSGHFLVYAFDLLYAFYKEENRLSEKNLSDAEIVDSIISDNLHGIDIDSRAVQLSAASLYIKAKEYGPECNISRINLVATDLGLTNFPVDGPSIKQFTETLKNEIGLDPAQSIQLIESLKGADYLGSLLQINEKVNEILDNGSLFNLRNRKAEGNNILSKKDIIENALKAFMLSHDRGDDIGIKTRAEQLTQGVRLLGLIGQKYHVVCANPPYLSKSKCNNKIIDIFKNGSELYEVFYYRFIEFAYNYGFISVLTAQNFMFISKFEVLRKNLLTETFIYRCLHLGSDTFQDVLNALGFTAIVAIKSKKDYVEGEYIRLERIPMKLKATNTLCPPDNRRFLFSQTKYHDLEGSPMIYWWPEEFRKKYLDIPKVKDAGEVRQGSATSNNTRYIRYWWEVILKKIGIISCSEKKAPSIFDTWQPYVKGAEGRRWFESLSNVIKWEDNGKEAKSYSLYKHNSISKRFYSQDKYFKQGIAFSYIGTSGFFSRLRKYKAVFDVSGSSIFVESPTKTQVLLSSSISGYVSQSINPTINNQVGDIDYLPLLDKLDNWQQYYDEVLELYDNNFAGKENNIEYLYQPCDSEEFEKKEISIRNQIDNEIFSHFSEKTVNLIQEEVGKTPENYVKLSKEELENLPKPLQSFTHIYLNGPYKYEFGEIKRKKDGTPERGKLQNLEELCHEFKLHPESIIALRKHLGMKRKIDRQDAAYRHLAWALGVALSRFDAQTGGLVDLAEERKQEQNLEIDQNAPKALPHGMFFLSQRGDVEEQITEEPNSNKGLIKYLKQILTYKHGKEKSDAIWDEIEQALVYDCKETITDKDRQKFSFNQFLREKCFNFHKSVYENRPIYFPLSSKKRTYVVWCNIHQWNNGTLQTVLAEFLMPEKRKFELRIDEMQKRKVGIQNKKELNDLEKTITSHSRWNDELDEFIIATARIAEKGPNSKAQERPMSYVMDLDDGVMINSAALWELLYPFWKDPKKWWGHLEKPVGKNDYDWSHFAMRYWPKRVWQKLEKDPSLAVAHSDYGEYKGRDLFKELHPEMAKKWEEEQAKKNLNQR